MVKRLKGPSRILLLCIINLCSAANIKTNVDGPDSALNNHVQQSIASDLEKQENNVAINDYKELVIEQARNTLAVYGYFVPDISAKIRDKEISLIINPGKPVVLKQVRVSPVNTITKTLVERYKKEINKPFNQVVYEDFKSDLLQQVRNNGYLNADYNTHSVTINKEQHRANVDLTLELNKLHYIDHIKINNLKQTGSSSKFIFSFLPENFHYNNIEDPNTDSITLTNKARYNSQEILDLQNNLSKYFSDVNIKSNIRKQHSHVNLIIDLKPIKNYFYNLGAGYGTDEGARVFGGLQIRNITDNGHKIDLQGKLAQYRENLAFNYIIPGFYPASDLATIGYQFRSDKKRNESHLEKERQQILSQYQRILDNGNLQYTGGISYRLEHYKNIQKIKSEYSQLFVPYFGYDQIFLDSGSTRIKTLSGLSINTLLEAADRNLISTTSFVRLFAKLKAIYPITIYDKIEGLRLITKGQLGQVWHKDEDKIPLTLRFFAGGSDSVRGYAYESLGPSEPNAKGKRVTVGGDRLVTFSAELEKTVYQNWSVAGFYDIGNSLNTWDKWRYDLYRGVGAGIRWQSPIGAIRFDVANALDTKDRPWRIDVNIGADL